MRGRALHLAIAAAALLVFALGSAVLGRSEPPSAAAATRVQREAADRVGVVRGGIVTPLGALEPVEIGGTMTATVELRSESGMRYARLLSVRLTNATGAVDDATIRVAGHMLAMDHGSFVATALAGGDGTYVVQLPFAMPGEWQLDVHVSSPGGVGDFSLDVDEIG